MDCGSIASERLRGGTDVQTAWRSVNDKFSIPGRVMASELSVCCSSRSYHDQRNTRFICIRYRKTRDAGTYALGCEGCTGAGHFYDQTLTYVVPNSIYHSKRNKVNFPNRHNNNNHDVAVITRSFRNSANQHLNRTTWLDNPQPSTRLVIFSQTPPAGVMPSLYGWR